ncbi:HNH endonuclease [Sodalis sp. RH16]|uniref:HNH endonuclease n=1 Tax=unclassified Sodalis (in: enterobacteria) TaxID=2636512 RepID=UPI0039B65365
MRPIDKGTWPLNKKGAKACFNHWRNAKQYLEERTGCYCHLCEMRVNNALAVEHIKPKDSYPRLSACWTNFLLICTPCNSRKSKSLLAVPYRHHYYWPHINNTLLAFHTPLTGDNAMVVNAHPSLSPSQKQKADATIKLYALDKTTTVTGDSDRRYLERQLTISMALERLEEYADNRATAAAIVDLAVSRGFFSLWMVIFSDYREVMEALLDARPFCQNRTAWFSAALAPLPRNQGQADPL